MAPGPKGSNAAPPLAACSVNFPPPGHNHQPCVSATLARARSAFETCGLKLTGLRLCVLGEIAASHRAIGAYEIIDGLAAKGTRLAPVSVYRALQALTAAGMVHRFESRNAYFACHGGHDGSRQPVVLACLDCGTIAEIDATDAFSAIDAIARRHDFTVTVRIAEVAGRCAGCTGRKSP